MLLQTGEYSEGGIFACLLYAAVTQLQSLHLSMSASHCRYTLLGTEKAEKFTEEYIHNKLFPTNNGTWGHGREEPKQTTPAQWVIKHAPNWMLRIIACCIIRSGARLCSLCIAKRM